MFGKKQITSGLVIIGAIFFLFEAVLHAFGLSILHHDDIFLFTHDRYIAIYAVTMFALMLQIATDVRRNKILFVIVMSSIALGIMNAIWIAKMGGYGVLFPAAVGIDNQLSVLGFGVIAWYLATWLGFILLNGRRQV